MRHGRKGTKSALASLLPSVTNLIGTLISFFMSRSGFQGNGNGPVFTTSDCSSFGTAPSVTPVVFKNATARFDIITLKAMLLFDVIPSDCTKRGKIAVRIVDKIKNESWWQNLNKQSTAVVFAVFMLLPGSNNSASRPVVGGSVPVQLLHELS